MKDKVVSLIATQMLNWMTPVILHCQTITKNIIKNSAPINSAAGSLKTSPISSLPTIL